MLENFKKRILHFLVRKFIYGNPDKYESHLIMLLKTIFDEHNKCFTEDIIITSLANLKDYSKVAFLEMFAEGFPPTDAVTKVMALDAAADRVEDLFDKSRTDLRFAKKRITVLEEELQTK